MGQAGGQYVCLRVSDTGCGMDGTTLARIYEPFFTTKAKEKGTGLGLSIVYGIVERHRGVIRVHSKVGAGTTFVVYFPAAVSAAAKPASASSENADMTGMETILLVEDEPAVRMLAARVLKRAGYDVREAADGVEACDVFNRHAPEIDLVLMDVIMPKMSGRDAYETIVKTRRDIPVIFCSGYSERELGAEFLQSHSLDLLAKPYRPEELLTRIRERLHPAAK
jgi:two-component system, cell cycle sensor histidine kinase and response regulator CckA